MARKRRKGEKGKWGGVEVEEKSSPLSPTPFYHSSSVFCFCWRGVGVEEKSREIALGEWGAW